VYALSAMTSIYSSSLPNWTPHFI